MDRQVYMSPKDLQGAPLMCLLVALAKWWGVTEVKISRERFPALNTADSFLVQGSLTVRPAEDSQLNQGTKPLTEAK